MAEPRTRTKQFNRGFRNEIMRLLLSFGCVPKDSLMSLPYHPSSRNRTITNLEREGIIEINRLETDRRIKHLIRLKSFEARSEGYLDFFEAGYYINYKKFVESIGARSRKGEEKLGRERMSRIGETGVLMYESGVKALMEDKLLIHKGNVFADDGAYFFLPTEIRSVEDGELLNSRMVGALTTPDDLYMVYNSGMRRLKWNEKGEIFGHITTQHACDKLCNRQPNKDSKKKALLMGDKKVFLKLMSGEDNSRADTMRLPTIYDQLLFTTNDKQGTQIVRQLTEKNWEKGLKDKYLYDCNTSTFNNKVPCDGMIGDKNVLLFAIPDLEKLNSFKWFADYDNEPENYEIRCYDFQADMLREAVKDSCTITVL